MKFMVTWTMREGQISNAAKRFLAGEAVPPKGVTLLGRWHAADLSCGWALHGADDPAALYALAVRWSEELAMKIVPVVEDEAAGAALAQRYS